MPATIPGAVLGQESGSPDSTWITDVRDALRDYPQWYTETRATDGTNGVIGSSGVPFTTVHKPIYDGGSIPPIVSVAGVPFAVDVNNPPAAGKVFLNYNQGEIIFATPPAAPGPLQITFQAVHFSDQQILTALYAGLRQMFPKVGRTYIDTSIGIRINQWDYRLPLLFSDPRTKILKLEIVEVNNNVTPFVEVYAWKRTGPDMITIPRAQSWSPTAQMRITYWGPYLKLADLEPQLYHLPVWYATSVLLIKQQATLTREDLANVVANETTAKADPLLMMKTASDLERRFKEALDELKRSMGPQASIRIVPSRALNDFGYRS